MLKAPCGVIVLVSTYFTTWAFFSLLLGLSSYPPLASPLERDTVSQSEGVSHFFALRGSAAEGRSGDVHEPAPAFGGIALIQLS